MSSSGCYTRFVVALSALLLGVASVAPAGPLRPAHVVLAASPSGALAARPHSIQAVSPADTAAVTPPGTTTVTPDTATATADASPISTATATSSPTATATATASPTATGTATSSPTATATFSPTGTATATARPSPTRRPVTRPRPRPTSTPRPTATPRAAIVVAPASINPGGVLTVSGAGFAPGEIVVVGLDGAAYAQTRATAQGLLAPTGFALPRTAATGRRAVFAQGVRSRRVARASVTVNPLRVTLRLDHADVGVGARLCASGAGFLPGEIVTVAVNSVSVTAATASGRGAVTACFIAPGNISAGPNSVTAVGASSGAVALARFDGAPGVVSTAYFVGASTAGGDETDIALVNPQSAPAAVTLRFYLPFAASFDRAVTVPAHARATVVLNPYVAGVRGFGLRVTSDRVVAAQMVVRRGSNNPYTSLGSGLLSRRWYLAEGYTGFSFHETILILNPNAAAATVAVQLLPGDGRPARVVTLVVPANRAYSVDVNRLYPRAAVAAVVTSSAPTSVERVMTFGAGGYGATGNTGTADAATSWLFAEGSTANGFETYLTVLNPGPRSAAVTAVLRDTAGRVIGARTIVVGSARRGTIRLNGVARASSLATTVTSDAPVVVERPLYFGPPNGGRTGGSIVFGRNGPGLSWTFPAGDTTPNSREFLLVQNPGAATLALRATFYLTDARTVVRDFSVPVGARLTIDVNRDAPALGGSLHGARLTVMTGSGFIAEQSIYNARLTAGYSAAGLAQ